MRVDTAPRFYPIADVSLEPQQAVAAADGTFFGKDGVGFDDVLQVVNPLQHIPVVGTIYRAITGDELTPGARVFGGLLFGGPIGLVAAVVTNLIDEATGSTPERAVMALLGGEAPAEAGPAAPATARGEAVAQATAAPVHPPPGPLPAPPAPAMPTAMAPAPAPALAEAALPRPQPVAAPLLQPARVAAAGATPQPRPGGDIPQLSPAAFDALIGMLGAQKLPTAAEPGSREAALALRGELERLGSERGLLPAVAR